MGIESDQLVFDYLSRVGDLAQQRQLPSATRMRLVTELRGEIDRHRAKVTVDSPVAVRRILDRLGSPDRLVSAAREAGAADPAAPLTRPLPEQRAPRGNVSSRRDAPSPPHLAGSDELGSDGDVLSTDWWRTGEGAETDSVPGFVGGVEIPEMLKAPSARRGAADLPDLVKRGRGADGLVEEDAGDADYADADGAAARERRGRVRGLRRRVPRFDVGGLNDPFLLVVAVALVAGAVLGNLLVLLIAWAVVYLSRRLTVGQKKWAVFGLPGLAAVGGIVWLWGRSSGRWGAPIADGRISGALQETWPWALKGAAVASALYLVWRAGRSVGR